MAYKLYYRQIYLYDDIKEPLLYRSNIKKYYKKLNLIYDYKINDTIKDKVILPHNEILRGHVIKKLTDLFIKHVKQFKNVKNLSKIFKYKKLEQFVQQWCWVQYTNPLVKDSIIPYIPDNSYNFTEFIRDFNFVMKTDLTLTTPYVESLINNVQRLIKNEYFNFINTLKIELPIHKTKKESEVILSCFYNDIEYSVIINNNVYIRLQSKLKNNNPANFTDEQEDKCIFCLFYRASYIDAENQQLAIHKHIKNMFLDFGVNFELFGSAINVISDHYCSMFYDIERFFGSKGDFFKLDIKSGIYWCNPPYIDRIMTAVGHKIKNILNTTSNVAFIITVPIWDEITRQHSFSDIVRNFNKNTLPEEHKDYPIYALLKPFIHDELIIPKNRIPYFNYRYYKPISATNTYMWIIYNTLLDTSIHSVFDKIIELDKSNYFQLN